MNQRLVLLYRAIIPFTLFFYSFYSLSRPLIVASLTVTPTSRRVSKDPQPFAGDNKDIAKRQQEYVNWCSQIRLVFLQDGDMFTTDMKKILHVAGLLTGDAQDVNRNDFDTIINNPHDPTMWKWLSIDAVFASLCHDPTSREHSRG